MCSCLKDYRNNTIPALGECYVSVSLEKNNARLPLVVVEARRANLLARNWFFDLGIAVAEIHSVSLINYLQDFPAICLIKSWGIIKSKKASFAVFAKLDLQQACTFS